ITSSSLCMFGVNTETVSRMSEVTTEANCIQVLDEHTANRIAAGEVIERPASVVKELVENAIDAGATKIWVNIEDGGKELIKVTDDGRGMTREDVVVALQRHATSKIHTAEDLFAIRTLGFRGEALPSIASVSIMEIVTKHASEPAATKLEVEAGTITNLESVGAPQGTTISVHRLFFNTPARLKFLRSAQTELSHITELIGRFALSYPSISFRLTHGSREVISVTGTGDVIGAAAAVFGRDVAKQLVPIEFEVPSLKVWGFVSKPSFTRANRAHQVFFVNRRCIRNKTLTHAADQAYRDLIIQPGRYPILIIFIDIDPGLVDVNVHPTKAEVKFSSDQEAHSALSRAIRDALMSGGAIPVVTEGHEAFRPAITDRQDAPPQGTLLPPDETDVAAFRQAVLRRSEMADLFGQDDPFEWSREPQSIRPPAAPVHDIELPTPVRLRNARVIGQARNMYILAECEDGVLIIDQHVAHERVLFEQLTKAKEGSRTVMQGLVVPITLELSRREGLVVGERLDDLRDIGFDIEVFGRDAFVVRAVPVHAKADEAEQLLRDIIAELVDISVTRHLVVRPEQVLITTACKLAIKAGDPLSMAEMEDLVKRLIASENPFVCPQGRPIIISLTNWELDRKFKRPTTG
ncbi:MAG TPA: DNA mismatch repair endonuclease MutL, partial [Armatimonadota bacterium]|nr:DNA mismatch repair endonuclease MutL [Armatimonadota bacterium]